MEKWENKEITYHFESASESIISDLKDIRYMDVMQMKNGKRWLVTRCNNKEIELMLLTRNIISQAELPQLYNRVSFIKRSLCW